jgi:drug/metabolite transporter (DMT)-like permease
MLPRLWPSGKTALRPMTASQLPPATPIAWLNNQPYLLLSLTSLFWAGNIVLGRYVAGHVPPITLSCIRWIGALLILLPFAWPHLARDWPALRARLPFIVLLSATGFAINNTLSYWALQYTQALNALLIQSSGPLFVALWSLLLFGVRLTWAQLLGISVFGIYSALMPRRPVTHPLSLIVVTMGIGALLMVPGALWEFFNGFTLKPDALTIATLVYVVIFPSALAYLFFNRGIALIGPNRAAPFFHLVPVFGSAMAILFLGEQPRLFHLVGYLLVLAGVVIASRQASA